MENRNVVMQLFGCLMKNPLLLGEVNSYNLTPDDFEKRLDKQIFAGIYNLFLGGAERITVADIDNYFKGHKAIYDSFVKANGIEYLQDAEELSVSENFPYYYSTLKKYNAVKDLKKAGFDTSSFYPENVLDENYEKKMGRFDAMTVQNIFDEVRQKLIEVEGKYGAGTNTKTSTAVEGLGELLESLKSTPDIGAALQGSHFNTVVRGARKGAFYLQSSGTGVGKTRGMVGDACYLAYPVIYDWSVSEWISSGSTEKVLYVGTEQTISEIQTLILSYLSGINEEKIISNRLTNIEQQVLEQAIDVMTRFEDNFTIVQLPDPTIQLVKGIIRKEVLLKDIEYVFYDYIFSSPGLLGEFRDLRIREDVVLGMLSTALKDICVELQVFLKSATQVNGDLMDIKGIRDQRCIRGSKAIADKIDCGVVTARVTKEELITLGRLGQDSGLIPTQVTDVYKLRRGRYNNVRIWSSFDLGTCRKKDLFITDEDFKPIEGFVPVELNFTSMEIGEIDEIVRMLNEGIMISSIGEAAINIEDLQVDNPKKWEF